MRYTGAKTVLCIVPINTLQNWVAEFDMWLPVRTKPSSDKKPSSEDGSSGAGESSKDNDDSSNGQAQGGQKSLRQFGLYVVNDMHKTTDSRLSVIGMYCYIDVLYR